MPIVGLDRLSMLAVFLLACAAEPLRGQEPIPTATVSSPSVETTGTPTGTPTTIVAPPDPSSTATTASTTTAVPASDGGVSRVELRFRDRSVPPPHHRSYTITLTPREIRKVVDSYGDVISDDKAPLAKADFDKLVADLQKLGLKDGGGDSGGCTGGTGYTVQVFSGSGKTLDTGSERCGGKESGPLVKAKAWIEAVEKRAPSGLKPEP